jgi:hypothetical protein
MFQIRVIMVTYRRISCAYPLGATLLSLIKRLVYFLFQAFQTLFRCRNRVTAFKRAHTKLIFKTKTRDKKHHVK